MLNFMVHGQYGLEPSIYQDNPHLTLLDMHVHVYIVADKYKVRNLAYYAIDEYRRAAANILNMNYQSDTRKKERSAHVLWVGSEPRPLDKPHHHSEQSPAAEMDRFLDSMVLLWKSTSSSGDLMRKAVMDMIKPFLHRLSGLRMFTLMIDELEGFGKDLVNSLGEDGMKVYKLKCKPGQPFSICFAVEIKE
jgi:hypothetical protein